MFVVNSPYWIRKKEDITSMTYKWLWRHFLNLLSYKQRYAVLSPDVNSKDALKILGVYEDPWHHFDCIEDWWSKELGDEGRVNYTVVNIRKLRYVINNLGKDLRLSKNERHFVPALSKSCDKKKLIKAIANLEVKGLDISTRRVPFRYLSYVLGLNVRQVFNFYCHFEKFEDIRHYHLKFNRFKDQYVFIDQAANFLKDMRHMKMLPVHKSFCMHP